jgi:hypothetical protein
VLKFQRSLVLYLNLVCLQHLSKVPDSQSSCSLCLCPSHHFGSSYHNFLIHSSVVGHLVFFHILTIVKSAVRNISIQLSLLYPNLWFLGRFPGVVSLVNMAVVSLAFWGNLYTAFHSGYTNLHPHQQCIRVPILPNPCKHLLLLLPLNMAILTGLIWNLIVVLIFISFVNNAAINVGVQVPLL